MTKDTQSITLHLATVLIRIKEVDQLYDKRNKLIFKALGLATELGYNVGVKIGEAVAYIDLPTGQISWHLPEYNWHWDGHTTAEKFRRIDQFYQDTMEEMRLVKK
jgi:hypothetical protein